MTQAPEIPPHIRRDKFAPVPDLLRLRDEQPVTRVKLAVGGTAWLVTRYSDIREVFGGSGRFSNAPIGPFREQNEGRSGFLLGYDAPEHTRLRRMLTPEFTVRRIRRLQPRIEAIVTEHLDAIEQAGPPADLVTTFALPIPSLVICELLGVPYEDRDGFQENAKVRLDMSRDMDERVAAVQQSRDYLAGLVRTARADPGEDMLGMLVREHGDELDDHELTGVADLLLLAGHETTSNMLSLGTLLLLRHPVQAAAVRSGELVDQAVEEMLRYLSIVHTGVFRTALEDVELSGQRIAAGDLVVCSLPSANRDPALGQDLGTFDITRKISAHMAFGHGLHHCLGAPLARMEMKIAYPALLRRFPNLALAVGYEEVPFRSFSFIYGLEALPLTW
ncbi:cytochrome P450 [Kibdelosporangium phytohabitans]|uniref:Cytochrome n=1 Tax=Kibdelosporangium phytohabitans TaxID=860235 RepID=A0A0N9I9F5_9PSEU|nr:cytochrome P450 [Kibdelosporangium phytohabitans]ALG11273.1 cytochrome [Kibdelosporangium phytohabitans]MBE1462563.1 cytochrome P450 [Kibdelosporangium phytohabitans]